MANFNIDYLIVAGGGAGGRDGGRGGGGGAGGLLTSIGQTPLTFSAGTQYVLTVGQGGLTSSSVINNGDDSELNGSDITLITATGGGRGGGGPNTGGLNRSGSAGGSGGGAIAYYSGGNPGTGNTPATTPSQGNNGGDALSTNQYGAGGGGGAGAAGSNGIGNNGGTGGVGITNSITVASGTGPYYAGGGAGGGTGGNVSGGSGGGGSFNNSTGIGSSGTNGLGGGGAGGGMATSASGGSGVIILRYTTSDIDSYTATGLTPTETIVGTDTVLSFTTVGTGTITFTTPIPPFNLTKVTTPVTDFNKINTEEGLKIPSGTSSNQPTGVEGMVRNDTTQSSKGSSSAITYYNGTNWRYFENELNTSFNTVLYTGTGAIRSITGVGFEPDLVWIKERDDTANHHIFDVLRGGNKKISSNTTSAEGSALDFTLDSDGFSINNAAYGDLNGLNDTYVAWCFKAGGLINKAADFNGSSSYITPSSSSTLTSLTKAVSIWIKSDNFTSIGTWPFQQGNGQSIENYIRFYNGSDIQIRWGNQTLTSSGYSTGVWYHIVAQEDANGFANFWIDGVEIATSTSSPSSVTGDTNIGRRLNSSSYQYYFNGQMAQLRLFSSSLDSTQIAQLYNETKADNSVLNFPSGAGCVAAYPLGENANGVDGLYNGTASSVTFGNPGYLTRNTEGTIESTVSVNNELGFSIASYTGNNTTGGTIGHGLSSTPELTIIKKTSGAAADWQVSLNASVTGVEGYMNFNKTAGLYTTYPLYYTSSNSTVLSSNGTSTATRLYNNQSENYIAYCFHSVPGYSKVGSYTGTGAGTTITTGFQPAFVMIKKTSGSADWIIFNDKTGSNILKPNTNASEVSLTNYITYNSTGFTFPTGDSNINTGDFIYLAFANTI